MKQRAQKSLSGSLEQLTKVWHTHAHRSDLCPVQRNQFNDTMWGQWTFHLLFRETVNVKCKHMWHMQWPAIVNQRQWAARDMCQCSFYWFRVYSWHRIKLSIQQKDRTILDSACVCMCACLEWQTFEFDAPLTSQQTWHYMEGAFLGFRIYKSGKQSTPFHGIAN